MDFYDTIEFFLCEGNVFSNTFFIFFYTLGVTDTSGLNLFEISKPLPMGVCFLTLVLDPDLELEKFNPI